MLVKEWNKLPDNLKLDDVKPYYAKLRTNKLNLILKRCFDIVMSGLLILLLAIPLLIISIWIKMDSKGPVFYRQERITQYGRVFRIFKFRTMVVDADKKGSLVTLAKDTRITRVGEKIRKLRIDELPQVFNIFIGDMSFVGTRPEVQKYVDRYTPEMMATLLLPAGVTSLASIQYKDEDEILSQEIANGRNVDDVYCEDILPKKMKYNLEYLNSINIFKEVAICIKTIL